MELYFIHIFKDSKTFYNQIISNLYTVVKDMLKVCRLTLFISFVFSQNNGKQRKSHMHFFNISLTVVYKYEINWL
jgi:hypothetical protein